MLMRVFALGGTTYGMAEETPGLLLLIVTVMIAAGYDALIGAAVILLGARHRGARLHRQPVRHRDRVRLRATSRSATASCRRLVLLIVASPSASGS